MHSHSDPPYTKMKKLVFLIIPLFLFLHMENTLAAVDEMAANSPSASSSSRSADESSTHDEPASPQTAATTMTTTTAAAVASTTSQSVDSDQPGPSSATVDKEEEEEGSRTTQMEYVVLTCWILEEICRVCRCEGTPDQPLFHPCLCSGSIKFIHQDW